MMPGHSQALLESIALLAASARNFRVRLVEGLKATERGPQLVEQGLMLATALAPEIGYDAAAAMAKEGSRAGARSASSPSRRASRRTALTSCSTRPG